MTAINNFIMNSTAVISQPKQKTQTVSHHQLKCYIFGISLELGVALLAPVTRVELGFLLPPVQQTC